MDFCRVFDMPCTFRNNTNNLSEAFKKVVIVKEADNTIKNFIKLDNVINSFQNILFEAYNNIEPIPITEKEEIINSLEDCNNEFNIFNSIFTITDNEHDILTNKQIQTILEESNISFSLIKAQGYLKSLGARPYRTSTGRGLQCITDARNDYDNTKIEF